MPTNMYQLDTYVVVLGVGLHGGDVDVVAAVEDVHLPEDAGHVAHLADVLLHHVLKLLLQTVVQLQGVVSLPLALIMYILESTKT